MLSGLRAGLVVAVHDAYLSMEGYRQAEGFVEDSVRVPKLAAPDMLAEILARRLSLIDSELAATDVFTAAALEQLFGYYSGAAKANLRKAMQAAQRAVQLAGEQDADLVAEAFVETAVSEWS